MATYTQTGIGIAGAFYPVKAGSATGARVGSGPDAIVYAESGTAASAFVASGLDVTTRAEIGSGVSGFVGSGAVVATHTYLKAGSGIAGNRFVYTKTGLAVTGRVASGASSFSATRIYTKAGSGITGRTASGARAGTSGKTGGNMVPPYGTFVYGDEEYGEVPYGGFFNDGRRIASGVAVVTSPPSIFTGGAISVRTASGLERTTYVETGKAAMEALADGAGAIVYGKTGGNMEPPYGSEPVRSGEYGSGYYGGFRNDGRRIASGFEEKELNRNGTGELDMTGNGFFRPPTSDGDVEISDADDILLEIEDLLASSDDEVVLTVTGS